MESSTHLSRLLSVGSISVPDYQRAYSWDTDRSDKSPKQVNTFLSDLRNYVSSHSSTPYYFGHFLFEEKGKDRYAVIDGQQRLTTAVIFLSALYKRLMEVKKVKSLKELDDDLFILHCNTIKLGTNYRFSTVGYDNQMFRDYVIDQVSVDAGESDTASQKRIAAAFDYFTAQLSNADETELIVLLNAITNASCTTHVVKDVTEAVQMFIFQNNRGKKPTNLEIIKAQFMYHIHLYAPQGETESILSEITGRFEKIYSLITQIEDYVNEDNILTYTIKVFRDNLTDISATDFITERLGAPNSIDFIRDFTRSLSSCFASVAGFLREEKENMDYHALLVSADKGIMFPFVIKAMHNGMSQEDLNQLARSLEQIFLRNSIVGTRANLVWRLNDCYCNMRSEAKTVVEHINWLKEATGWWGYWNNEEIARCLGMGIYHETAKILLWKYENHLIESGKRGYKPIRYDSIDTPHLEHIAPQTENTEADNGYCPYDEDFVANYLECLGNYLLLSGSHNISLSNGKFQVKRESYTHLQQQLEVQEETKHDLLWDKEKIRNRQNKIVGYLKEVL